MNKLFNTAFNLNYLHIWLFVLRVFVAISMCVHGYPKLQQLLAGGEIKFADPIGIGMTMTLVLAVFAEVICSVLIGIGLATRAATIPLIITMLVATFVVHAGDGFKVKEMALFYLFVYLTILVTGPGKYSVDNRLQKK